MTCQADVKNVFHNSETGQFEADVTLLDRDAAETFSVEVLAPITAEFEAIRPALIRAALARRNETPAQLSRRRMAEALPDRTEQMLERILFAEPSYLDAILARPAA